VKNGISNMDKIAIISKNGSEYFFGPKILRKITASE
jgi:hypothetical protein